MPTHKPMKKDAVLETAIAGYTKDPSTIDIFSSKDKIYSKKVNEGIHNNLPASLVKNMDEEPVEALLNVSSDQDLDYVSCSFGPKYRIALASKKSHDKPVMHDAVLEKALAGFTKDPSKIDIFTAEDKTYSEHVNFGLSHHMPPSFLNQGAQEQARPSEKPKAEVLLNVSSKEDLDFASCSFGPKSRA